MRESLELLRAEPRARWFFATLTQSALGNGAGYVALLLVAYDRLGSPWAVSLVLVADLAPAMALGPVFGAAADRFSRRTCCVVADLVRAAAFVGIALAPSFELTLVFALLAGTGTALFTPAALASLPAVVTPRRLPAATSLFGAVADLGFTVGPAVAAAAFLVVGPEALLVVNALTFLLSAGVLSRLPFAQSRVDAEVARTGSLMADARAGLVALRGLPVMRAVLAASGAGLLFAALFNAAELPFVTEDLGGGDAAFGLLVAVFGAGFIGGSLAGAGGGAYEELRRHYLLGLLLMAAGVVAAGSSSGVVLAGAAFAVAGVGNGLHAGLRAAAHAAAGARQHDRPPVRDKGRRDRVGVRAGLPGCGRPSVVDRDPHDDPRRGRRGPGGLRGRRVLPAQRRARPRAR